MQVFFSASITKVHVFLLQLCTKIQILSFCRYCAILNDPIKDEPDALGPAHLDLLFKYNFSDNQLLGSRPAGVHPPDPFELVAGLDLFGHAFGLGELEGNEINLLICLAVDIDEMLHQSVLHQHQREGIGLMPP